MTDARGWRVCRSLILAFMCWFVAQTLGAQTPTLVLASTTSTEQSGLFAHLLPLFQKATGIAVKVVAVGSGQAIDMARRGDADVLLAHDPSAEEKLVADGFALRRLPVMYNDFVLVGPAADPARVRGLDAVQADPFGLLSGLRLRHGAGIEHGRQSGGLPAYRSWHLAGVCQPGQSGCSG